MSQVVGIIDILWLGRKIPTEKGAKFMPGALKNNPVVAGRRVHRSQEFKAGEVSCTTVFPAGAKYADMYSSGEGELQVLCDSGQVLVWPDAFLSDVPGITGGDGGKVELKWAVGDYMETV